MEKMMTSDGYSVGSNRITATACLVDQFGKRVSDIQKVVLEFDTDDFVGRREFHPQKPSKDVWYTETELWTTETLIFDVEAHSTAHSVKFLVAEWELLSELNGGAENFNEAGQMHVTDVRMKVRELL